MTTEYKAFIVGMLTGGLIGNVAWVAALWAVGRL